LEEFCRVEREFHGNALAAHGVGRVAQTEMNRVTAKMAELLNIRPSEIIFTSGASESNNLAIKGLTRAYKHVGKHILSTCLEHPSVSGTLAALQEDGYDIELVKILPDGKIDLAALDAAIRPDTVLLCISAVDSELGAIQPIAEIVKILAKHPHCHLHVDAAQAIGKIPVHFNGVSTMSFSPHKFHGLCGSGVLVKREDVVLEPLIHGGAAQTIYRSGTPTLGLAAACCKALELSLDELDEHFKKVTRLRQYVLDGLKGYDLVRVNLADGGPYILNLSVAGIKAIDFQSAMDKHGVAISVKSACSTDRSPSRPVMAVTRDKKNARSSWRVSFSHLTTCEALDTFLAAFDAIYKEYYQ